LSQPVNAIMTWLVRNEPTLANRPPELEASDRWLMTR
jgi:hypothetical protein